MCAYLMSYMGLCACVPDIIYIAVCVCAYLMSNTGLFVCVPDVIYRAVFVRT